jgi:hypothetical protein
MAAQLPVNHPVPNSPRKSWRDPRVLIAVIVALATIIVGFWQFHPETVKDNFSLAGRVYAHDKSGIEGATLTFWLPGKAPLTKPSRDQGSFIFSNLPSLTGILTISANGYAIKTLDITAQSAAQNLEVELVSNIVSPSVVQEQKVSPTPVQARKEPDPEAHPAPAENPVNLTALYSALTSDLNENFGVTWTETDDLGIQRRDRFSLPKLDDCRFSWRDSSDTNFVSQATDSVDFSVDLVQLKEQDVDVINGDYGYRFVITSPNPGAILKTYPKIPGALEAKPSWVEFRLSRYDDRILSQLRKIISTCRTRKE